MAWPAALLVAFAGLLASCGGSDGAPGVPPLPGVAADDEEWFWRDVLGAPLPGERAPRRDVLDIATPVARSDALAALAEGGDPAALTTLLAALADPQIGVACNAAHDLGTLGSAAAVPRLLKGLGPYPIDYDVPIEVRAAEASALARLGNPAGMPLILKLLAEGTELEVPWEQLEWTRTERTAFMRELALDGLVALAGTDFDYAIMGSVPTRTEAVRRARAWWDEQRTTLWAAAPLTEPTLQARVRLLVGHLAAYQLRQVDGARYTLVHLGPAVLPFLEDGLAGGDDYVRLHCLEVLDGLTDLVGDKVRGRIAKLATPLLLEDPVSVVAAQAARVCGSARVGDMLIIALDRRSEADVRLAIVDALGETGRSEALAALDSWKPNQRPSADLTAAIEAARLRLDGGRDPEPFLALLADQDAGVAYAALQRLVALVGEDCGLDPMAPPRDREPALQTARRALQRRDW